MRTINNICAAPAASALSHREEDGNYRAVVANLNNDWRVIECRDGLQWIIQKRRGERNGQARFEGKSFCSTRDGLILTVAKKCGDITFEGKEAIFGLPARIGGAA